MDTLKSNDLKNIYFDWLSSGFKYTNVDDRLISISTPFIDSDFDHIQIYAQILDNNEIRLTDSGYTLFNLESHGITVNNRSKTRKEILENILSDFGILLDSDTKELTIKTVANKFGPAKNRLLQAIFRVNDLIYLSNSKISSSFNEMVAEILTESEINFVPSFSVPWHNGSDLHFDFSIPSHRFGESLIQTTGRPYDINQAKIFNYDVSRMQSVNRKVNKYTLLINDSKRKSTKIQEISKTAKSELTNKNVYITPFTDVLDNPQLLLPA
ncbi:DUF1828 domain-containing protein [Convivina praedatoris]|uniref:DUF1828 domain-containing protein n=1 Tax=Convivina praedatoris TaxID=2880963 RepID=A0ABM9D2J5_9LACO|nr:DUF1828 domain-containing protein [Convivina sp. LMG 32447]CAH1854502.1 hypothetical protein R077815_01062 [Convivina sp. LMG 32447]CAH1855719.1 hypothetical protein R078138_01197 [Convivina sp. LMG 32447]CAH1855843.1 hypothetical protein LMG032447_01176 [Convivina sp. LMG 32447]